VIPTVLSQILQLAESGREDGTGLCRQRIELLRWAQLSCRSQLTFADHMHDFNTCDGYRR
jgi:hypothetical protein